MLEKMAEFFENRIDGYDEHMLKNIDGADEFYPFTAENLPTESEAKVLDLGCGTGLELEYYFRLNPTAKVTGIDLSKAMLSVLGKKFLNKDMELICDSYFDTDFGENRFDGVVSVESLHHFTKAEKVPLYMKIHRALKENSCLILTDYFSFSDEEETKHRAELERLKKENNITDNEFYHYDTPLTVEHEIEALKEAGFERVEVLKNWGATCCLIAEKTGGNILKMKSGCEVPFPERINEGFEVQNGKIIANVSIEKVRKIMTDFIDMHDEPLFMILEVPTNEKEEPKDKNGEIECFHKDVYYIDGCTQEAAKGILEECGEVLCNDGLCNFGFGGHFSNEEIVFGKYNVMTAFVEKHEKGKMLFEQNGIERRDSLLTAWETFSTDNYGVSRRIAIEGIDIYVIIEKLKNAGLYFAERREEF